MPFTLTCFPFNLRAVHSQRTRVCAVLRNVVDFLARVMQAAHPLSPLPFGADTLDLIAHGQDTVDNAKLFRNICDAFRGRWTTDVRGALWDCLLAAACRVHTQADMSREEGGRAQSFVYCCRVAVVVVVVVVAVVVVAAHVLRSWPPRFYKVSDD